MKTIKKNGEIKRVEDSQADTMVTLGGWEYCGKEDWKAIRKTTTKKSNSNLEVDEISGNLSDKKKRKARKENKRKKYESK